MRAVSQVVFFKQSPYYLPSQSMMRELRLYILMRMSSAKPVQNANIHKKIAIIGAGSAIAKECARIWSEKYAIDFILIGRNSEELNRFAQDLRVRNSQSVVTVKTTDFLDPHAIDSCIEELFITRSVDIALIAQGVLPDQTECQEHLKKTHDVLDINGVSPLLFAEGFAKNMAKVNHGTVAIIGSVAGDRGRKSNYVYGAAKAMIHTYVQGLQHRFAQTPIKIIVIKPGPTDTPMTAHLKAQGANLSSVNQVAKIIVQGIDAGRPVIYAPGIWRFIMTVIMHIPNFIFKRLNL